MRKDFEIIRHNFPNEIAIYPISDVHLGALECNEREWEKVIKEILDQPNAYVILNGDLINNSTRSSVGNIFEETLRPREQKKKMVEYLAPLRDRILCITTGNHERRSVKDADDDPTYDIACKLDIEELYRENIAFVSVGIGTRKTEKGRPCCIYSLAVTHGAGGGIYTGAAVNRNERFANVIDGLDCLVVGHTHKGTVTRPTKLVIDQVNGVVYQRDFVVISSTSWVDYGGYAAQKMLLPAASSRPQKIILRNRWDRQKRIDVSW